MLEVRKPGNGRNRQAPAKKTRALKYGVDTPVSELGRGRPIEPKRQCGEKSRAVENTRPCDLDRGDLRERGKLGGIGFRTGEQNWNYLAGAIAVQRGKQVKLIIVSTG